MNSSGAAKAAISDDDPRSALKDLVGAMCDPDDSARDLMSGLEARRRKWMTRLDMIEEDWPDAVEYATLGPGERMSGEVQLVDSDGDPLKRAWSALDPIDQYVMLSTSVTVDKSDRPQTVNARYAEGLKPGMFVVVTEDVVVAAWSRPGASTPSAVFGVELK